MSTRKILALASASLIVALLGCTQPQRPAPTAEPTGPPSTEATSQAKALVEPTGTPYAPQLDPANFVSGVTNEYLPLKPGSRWTYRTVTADGIESNDVVVTNDTRKILGIDATVVHDTVKVGGQLTEDTYDWYAQERDGTVWYLGEDTKELENGKVVSTKGSWEAGKNGSQPGVIIQASPVPGTWYWQEYSEGNALDQARVVSIVGSEKVPFGTFDKLLVTEERSLLEPGVLSRKYYAQRVGMVAERSTRGPTEVSVLESYSAK